ncbi:MAG: HAD-IA family hydrolase [Treponema sp.]
MLYIFDMGGVVTTTAAIEEQIARKLGISERDFMRFCGCPDGNASYGKPDSAMGAAGKSTGKAASSDGFDLLTMYSNGFISAKEFWRLFSARSGIAVKTDWWHLLFHPVRNDAVIDIIAELKKRGDRVVCGTNTIESHYLNHLERGDYAIFDQTYASCFMGVSKPAPDFWNIILAAEDTTAKDAFFIDDRAENCAAASVLGLHTFHFAPPYDAAHRGDCIAKLRTAAGLAN